MRAPRKTDEARAGSGRAPRAGRSPALPSAAELGLPESPNCPFCGGAETELHSPFGPALSVAGYWCRRCRTAFEWIKWDAPGADGR